MSRYVFSYYDGKELVLYQEFEEDPMFEDSDMGYLGFHKECTKMIMKYEKSHPNAHGHGEIYDNVLGGPVKSWRL